MVCDKEFVPIQNSQKYCSYPCRQFGYRQRSAERQKRRQIKQPHYKKVWYRKWAKDNPEKAAKERVKRNNSAAAVRAYVWEIKTKSVCRDCGEQRPEVLCFHHRDGSAKARELSRCITVEGVNREAAKCDVLCMNCHTYLHYWQGRKEKHA